MKTTIDIPDDIYRQIKAEAALRGLTIRELTTRLYRRWLREGEDVKTREAPTAWLHSWLDAADEAIRNAPEGSSARDELVAGRDRLGDE